jgi:hypothetical protein
MARTGLLPITSVPGWSWRYLEAPELSVAYPVVTITGGGFDLPGWLQLGRAWLEGREKGGSRGIAVVTARGGTIVAVMLVATDHGRSSLHVAFMRVLEISDIMRTIEAALEVTEVIALGQELRQIMLRFDHDHAAGGMLETLIAAEAAILGLERSEGALVRRVPPAGAVSGLPDGKIRRVDRDRA